MNQLTTACFTWSPAAIFKTRLDRPNENKTDLGGFSGEIVLMLSLTLIKSTNSNHENPPNKILNLLVVKSEENPSSLWPAMWSLQLPPIISYVIWGIWVSIAMKMTFLVHWSAYRVSNLLYSLDLTYTLSIWTLFW